MSSATRKSSLLDARRRIDFSAELARKGGYHSFELPDGTHIDGYMSVAHQQMRYGRFPIPGDLRGKRILDIGAWDGWFSFEAERHGAAVTAVDCVEVPRFLEVHRALRSKVEYRAMDFYELPCADLGKFDIVFFLGVLYHVRHPLLALEIVCGLTTDVAIVDSFVTDGDVWREHPEEIPTMEFYELDELGDQFGSWVGPSVKCLLAMCRAAGFARVELLFAGGDHAAVACYRRWEARTEAGSDSPEMLSLENGRNFGINFSTRHSEEYISCVFRSSRERVTAGELRGEVDEMGMAALFVTRQEDQSRQEKQTWRATFRLPPGLSAGWHKARLRFRDSMFGADFPIAVDLTPKTERVWVKEVRDGVTWNEDEVKVGERGFLSCWVGGLPENVDRANVKIFLGDRRLETAYTGPADDSGYRQVNATVPGGAPKGEHPVRIECAGVTSEPRGVKLI